MKNWEGAGTMSDRGELMKLIRNFAILSCVLVAYAVGDAALSALVHANGSDHSWQALSAFSALGGAGIAAGVTLCAMARLTLTDGRSERKHSPRPDYALIAEIEREVYGETFHHDGRPGKFCPHGHPQCYVVGLGHVCECDDESVRNYVEPVFPGVTMAQFGERMAEFQEALTRADRQMRLDASISPHCNCDGPPAGGPGHAAHCPKGFHASALYWTQGGGPRPRCRLCDDHVTIGYYDGPSPSSG